MDAVTRRCWRQRPALKREAVDTVAGELRLPPLAVEILARRELPDGDAVRAYLTAGLGDLPDPDGIPGMVEATDRLVRAICDGESILVHGDYDVDGISGTSLLVDFLRRCGARVAYHIPLRLRDGYGLSAEALRHAAAQGTDVVVSVDCGISAVAEAHLARELGLDLVITDHHLPPAQLPDAVALVNPRLEPCVFPDRNLAGVGVAFFLVIALRRRLRERGHFRSGEPDVRELLDLVALGTIADVVPLQGTNRLLVKKGLEWLSLARRPGMAALLAASGVARVTCGSVAFQLAPRLNAAGRLEDAALGVELLLSRDPGTADEIARRLDGFNRERREIEQATLDEAVQMVEALPETRRSIVLAGEGWHAGVIGIVASRLVERFHRPALLVAFDGDEGKGSARSVPGFNLHAALHACADDLAAYGGHAAAAGFSIGRFAFETFVRNFEQVSAASEALVELDPIRSFDAETSLAQLDLAAVETLEAFTPFGAGNPEPLVCLRDVRVQQVQDLNGGHVRFTVRQDGLTLPGIAFGFAERRDELCGELDMLATPQVNRWKGRNSVQLVVKDLRRAGEVG